MFWLFITMGMAGISQWYNQRLAASVGALLVFGCLVAAVPSRSEVVHDGSRYVGQASGTTYHVATEPRCPIQQQEVWFTSQGAAVAAGRIPCTCVNGQAAARSSPLYTPQRQTTGDRKEPALPRQISLATP